MAEENIPIEAFDYFLPEEKIALHPKQERDASKLLCYRSGEISGQSFRELPGLLPEGTALVFNQTKVIEARWLVEKDSGTKIEIFLLSPVDPYTDIQQALQAGSGTSWKCMIGNKKRWKENETIKYTFSYNIVYINWKDREQDIIEFSWENYALNFADILSFVGQIPIPPYLNRKADHQDQEGYQTVFSLEKGSVAAPTAGLHFTEQTLAALADAGIPMNRLTLHVGAGTFRPVKTSNALAHEMHAEEFHIRLENLAFLFTHAGHIIPVGTTSLRTLESVYWIGVKMLAGKFSSWEVHAHEITSLPQDVSPQKAIGKLMEWMHAQNITSVTGYTSIYIYPGYTFRMIRGLITNFHQPKSTLLLLVAALIGEDWKKVYQFALEHDFRFLSYGDSSLLIP